MRTDEEDLADNMTELGIYRVPEHIKDRTNSEKRAFAQKLINQEREDELIPKK